MVKHCIAFGCQNRSSKAECKDLSWHSLPLSNKNLLAQWLVKLRRENTPVNKNSYVCSQHFEANCFIKPMGGQRIRLKPDSVPTKFIFTVEKPKRKEPADRATLNTKKTKIEKSQQHSAPEPINIENTDFKPVSDGMETEHLESEGLFQIVDENWEHQLQWFTCRQVLPLLRKIILPTIFYITDDPAAGKTNRYRTYASIFPSSNGNNYKGQKILQSVYL